MTPEESANVKDYNFDHPNAMDQAAIVQCLCDLKNRLPVEVPIYDFKTHRRVSAGVVYPVERATCDMQLTHQLWPPCSRAAKTQTVYPADIIIFEGILVRPRPCVATRLTRPQTQPPPLLCRCWPWTRSGRC